MEKILVLRGGALGDFIVTLPALAAIRTRWPQSRIELAGNAVAAQLARSRGLLDAVHSQHEARWSALYGSGALSPEFAGWLATFELVLNYWPDPGGEIAARFPLRPGQRFLAAPALPTEAPAAAHYFSPLKQLGLSAPAYWYRIRPLNEGRRHDRDQAGPPASVAPIVIHPGSGSPRKNWAQASWRRLIAALPPPVLLVLGEAERGEWSGSEPPVPRLVQPPLEELVGVLNACRMFLGHDSGVSHLAAACGARCVLLFGPTEPAWWAPPVPSVRVVRSGSDLATLEYDAVQAAVRAALADQK